MGQLVKCSTCIIPFNSRNKSEREVLLPISIYTVENWGLLRFFAQGHLANIWQHWNFKDRDYLVKSSLRVGLEQTQMPSLPDSKAYVINLYHTQKLVKWESRKDIEDKRNHVLISPEAWRLKAWPWDRLFFLPCMEILIFVE